MLPEGSHGGEDPLDLPGPECVHRRPAAKPCVRAGEESELRPLIHSGVGEGLEHSGKIADNPRTVELEPRIHDPALLLAEAQELVRLVALVHGGRGHPEQLRDARAVEKAAGSLHELLAGVEAAEPRLGELVALVLRSTGRQRRQDVEVRSLAVLPGIEHASSSGAVYSSVAPPAQVRA
jgi:hypothetical protein